jgi:hypothetical protein
VNLDRAVMAVLGAVVAVGIVVFLAAAEAVERALTAWDPYRGRWPQ